MNNDEMTNLKLLFDKTNNEKVVLEGMLFEFKVKYAEIQNKIGEYRDQNESLRRKLDDANESLSKKEEIIKKFMLSKEKIPLSENLQAASRLDLTLALTEGNLNSNRLALTRSCTPKRIDRMKALNVHEESKVMTTSPNDMTFMKAPKSNYNTNNDQKNMLNDLDITLGNGNYNSNTYSNTVTNTCTTPEKNISISVPKKTRKNSSTFLKKIKSLFFSEKKTFQ